MTVIEVTIASMVLIVALGTFLGALMSGMSTSRYGADRNQALDDLRTTAAVFSKDVRQAVSVSTATQSRVVLSTYVGGALKTVTWEAVTAGTGEFNLQRTLTTGSKLYVVKLTTNAVFSYFGEVDPTKVHRIRLFLASKPSPKHPELVINSDVEMRNAQ
jgi:hypothetical protein